MLYVCLQYNMNVHFPNIRLTAKTKGDKCPVFQNAFMGTRFYVSRSMIIIRVIYLK